MTEAAYKKVKNPEAYAQEQAFNKLRSEHLEKVEKAYETGKAETAKEFESEIEKLNRQLKEAEKQISQLTEPDKADKAKK
jgi:predicted ATPase